MDESHRLFTLRFRRGDDLAADVVDVVMRATHRSPRDPTATDQVDRIGLTARPVVSVRRDRHIDRDRHLVRYVPDARVQIPGGEVWSPFFGTVRVAEDRVL